MAQHGLIVTWYHQKDMSGRIVPEPPVDGAPYLNCKATDLLSPSQ